MIRLIAGSTFAVLVATSVQAMTPAPMPGADSMITRVAFGCGLGQTLVNGHCVARVYIRQARRAAYGVGAPYYGVGATGFNTNYYYGGPEAAYYTMPHYSPYNHYVAGTSNGPWYAVRAYYAGGPWYYGINGWSDYAATNGLGCTPGTVIKGGDGINYACQ